MTHRRWRGIALGGLAALAAACGGGPSGSAESGVAPSAAGVEVSGHVVQRGARGSVLVFAYGDLGATDDPAGREPTSVGSLAPDGSFEIGVPPGTTLTMVFLADGANDGAIDAGDPIAVLASPELNGLQAGDRVQISDAKLDFAGHRVDATVEVARAAAPAHTPTPVPGA
jgi:hypothetical protein